jgi:hypothetical protein
MQNIPPGIAPGNNLPVFTNLPPTAGGLPAIGGNLSKAGALAGF